MSRVLIVGGGITGLAAALRLRELAGPELDIVIADRADRLGGKLRTGQIAGVPVELGAESFLIRRPEAARLVEKAGLADAIVHPAPLPAALAVDGALRPIPKGTLLGVPADIEAVAATGVLTPDGEARMRDEKPVRLDTPDASVGELVRAAFGDEVADRLVDPLLGGVYAGHADELSVRATAPALAEAARTHEKLSDAVRSTVRPGAVSGPVFGAVAGGMTMLVEAVALTAGAELRLGQPVRELTRTATGWRATLGPVPAPEHIDADAVLIAVPAKPASRLLAGISPEAAEAVEVLRYASMALITMAFEGTVELPELSGFLVPATEGRTVKASTFFSQKWPHRKDPLTILRCSIGRAGQEEELQHDDDDLIATARADFAALTGVELPEPVDAHVTRWGGGLPQYAPGHDDRVAAARAALASEPTLALAGAAFDGVGIPACIGSGERAAEALYATLG